LFTGIVGVSLGACSVDEGGGPNPNGPTSGAGGFDAGDDADIDAEFGMGGNDDDRFDYTELCGEGCLPETGEPSARECEPPPRGGGGAGGEGGAGGAGGAEVVTYDCRLMVSEGSGEVNGVCAETGAIGMGDSCLTSSDCAPGFACVEGNSCRPYCCGDVEACPSETYCAPRNPVAADLPDGVQAVPQIPVCVAATNCTLLDEGSCPEGESCTIVRVDGTTSCVKPGNGVASEACPCAEDHVCNTSKNECLKLCKLGRPGDCPPTHFCQAGGAIYPQDFGICVSQ
jgi:hypothetical protein